MKKYFVDGKQICEEEAKNIKDMNDLYFYLAENGDFNALSKIEFIVEV